VEIIHLSPKFVVAAGSSSASQIASAAKIATPKKLAMQGMKKAVSYGGEAALAKTVLLTSAGKLLLEAAVV